MRLDPPDECLACGADTYRTDGLCAACMREARDEARAEMCEDDRERDFDDERFAPEWCDE